MTCDVNKVGVNGKFNFFFKIVLNLKKSYTVTVKILNLLQLTFAVFDTAVNSFFATYEPNFAKCGEEVNKKPLSDKTYM